MKKNRETMTETVFNISPQSEMELRDALGSDLKQTALDILVLIGYRNGKLNFTQVRRILGFDDRFQTENWLSEQSAAWNIHIEDLRTDRNDLYLLFPDNTP
jgi:hypothetical protein